MSVLNSAVEIDDYRKRNMLVLISIQGSIHYIHKGVTCTTKIDAKRYRI